MIIHGAALRDSVPPFAFAVFRSSVTVRFTGVYGLATRSRFIPFNDTAAIFLVAVSFPFK
jgi:hypothetical protein